MSPMRLLVPLTRVTLLGYPGSVVPRAVQGTLATQYFLITLQSLLNNTLSLKTEKKRKIFLFHLKKNCFKQSAHISRAGYRPDVDSRHVLSGGKTELKVINTLGHDKTQSLLPEPSLIFKKI